MSNKKAQLQTLAILILVIISLVIAITFIFQSGLFSSTLSFFNPTMTTASAYTRGIPIYVMWNMYDAATMRSTGLSLEESIFSGISNVITRIQDSIPLLAPPAQNINLKYNEPCAPNKGVSKEVFMKTVAEHSIDCWNMYTAGKYDPLRGKTPPNPRICFAFQFNINDTGVTFNEMKQYFETKKISQQDTYLSKFRSTSPGSSILVEQNGLSKTIKKGVFFIGYSDTAAGGFNSEECGTYSAPPIVLTCDMTGKFSLSDFISSWGAYVNAEQDKKETCSGNYLEKKWCEAKNAASDALSDALKTIGTAYDLLTNPVGTAKQELYNVIKQVFVFTNLQDCGTKEGYLFSCPIKSELVSGYNMEFACKFQNPDMTRALNVNPNELSAALAHVLDWSIVEGDEGKGCSFEDLQFSSSGTAGISLSCDVTNEVLFDVLFSSPDNLHWCIEEDATLDGSCQPFTWS